MTSGEKLPSSGLDGVRAALLSEGAVEPLLEARTRAVDELVIAAWTRYLAPVLPGPAALLAVGGYGRRQLFPCSDVDLLLLVDKGVQATSQREALQEFLRELWDTNLRLGHSVRTPQECAELHAGNTELSISLLDRRLLAGDPDFYASFEESQRRFFQGRRHDLRRALSQMLRSRHLKFQNTVFHLEPNLKESPGGLRDMQTIRWLEQLEEHEPGSPQIEQVFPALADARLFQWSARAILHSETNRDSNHLTFELQERLATYSWFAAPNAAAWMRQYFHHARVARRLAMRSIERVEERSSGLFGAFREWRSRLATSDVSVAHELLLLKSPHRLSEDVDLVFHLFTFAGRHRIRLAWDTERRIQENLPQLKNLIRGTPRVWTLFSQILMLPHVDLALEAMHESGFLNVLLPPWEDIQSLVLRDFHHRYTVDEHTLVAVRHFCDLLRQPPEDLQRFASLAGEIERRDLLLLAILLHDTGKAVSGAGHAAESVRLAEEVLVSLQVPSEERAVVRYLIEDHLLLSSVMNSRDLEDPKTAEFVAHRVGTPERLKLLTLITFADISAVHPGALTAWRRDQLWRTYLVSYKELTRELHAERIEHGAAGETEEGEFLEGFPRRYLHTHTPRQVASHFALEKQRRVEGVGISLERKGGYWETTLVTEDRPNFFATIAGLLASFGLSILKAEAFSNSHGILLDTFTFSDPNHNLDLNPPEVEQLRVKLRRAALGRVNVADLLRNRPTPKLPSSQSAVPPSVRFDGTVATKSTLVEVVAMDRPGLLFDLSRTMSEAGCDIEVVLIETQGHRAVDVFYINRQGKKLMETEEQELREKLLSVCYSNPR